MGCSVKTGSFGNGGGSSGSLANMTLYSKYEYINKTNYRTLTIKKSQNFSPGVYLFLLTNDINSVIRQTPTNTTYYIGLSCIIRNTGELMSQSTRETVAYKERYGSITTGDDLTINISESTVNINITCDVGEFADGYTLEIYKFIQ